MTDIKKEESAEEKQKRLEALFKQFGIRQSHDVRILQRVCDSMASMPRRPKR